MQPVYGKYTTSTLEYGLVSLSVLSTRNSWADNDGASAIVGKLVSHLGGPGSVPIPGSMWVGLVVTTLDKWDFLRALWPQHKTTPK